jgi:hypothetical protein
MKNYVVIYFVPAELTAAMSEASPEEMEKGMEAWMVWAKACGDGLVDLGTPLGNGYKISSTGSSASSRGVAGYSILQAESMDAAKQMLDGHPHLGWGAGCEIEVYESMPLPQ